MPDTSLFSNAHGFTINGGHFSHVSGDQTNITDSFNATGCRNIKGSFNIGEFLKKNHGTREESAEHRDNGELNARIYGDDRTANRHAQNPNRLYETQQPWGRYHTLREEKQYHHASQAIPALSNSDSLRFENTPRRLRGQHRDSYSPEHRACHDQTTATLKLELSSQYGPQVIKHTNEARSPCPPSWDQIPEAPSHDGDTDRGWANEEEERFRRYNNGDCDEPVRVTQHHSQSWRREPYDDYARPPLDRSQGNTGSPMPYRAPYLGRVTGDKKTTARLRYRYEEAEKRGFGAYRSSNSKRDYRRNDGLQGRYQATRRTVGDSVGCTGKNRLDNRLDHWFLPPSRPNYSTIFQR
ncbi:hypothetical protein PM082_002056 [Marasmius tenuissimus]|nr:hypothetical protein PM082_002056 [Marasmius tenuissimus]